MSISFDDRKQLIEDCKDLLLEVRAGLNNELNHSLIATIDEAIELLKELERYQGVDPQNIKEVLVVIGRGLAAVPYIAKLIESLSD